MESLNLADAFVTFFALVGPQKVLLAIIRMARTRDVRSARLVAGYAAVSAAAVGVACALTAPWLATFFHITKASVELAAAIVFFVYAIELVFGVHLGEGSADDDDADGDAADAADARHPLASGYRELLLPFIVSPLGVAAAFQESLTASGWGTRGIVAGAYAAVVAVDLAAFLVFAPVMRRAHPTSLEVLSRLLGILLTAVAVNLFLQGLASLGLHVATGH